MADLVEKGFEKILALHHLVESALCNRFFFCNKHYVLYHKHLYTLIDVITFILVEWISSIQLWIIFKTTEGLFLVNSQSR